MDDMVERMIEELEGECNQHSQSETSHQPAWIDVVQTRLEEQPTE